MQRTPGTRCRAQSQPYRQTAGQFINVVIRNTDDIQALALCEECGTLTEYRLVGERDGLVILKCVRCGYNRFIKSIAIEILFRILAALKRSGIQALGAVNGSCADKDSYVLKQGGRPRDVDTTFLIPAYQLPRTLEVLKEILKEMAKTLGIPVEAGVICIPRAGFHGRIVLFLVRADGKVKRIKLHQRPLLHKLIWWISGFNAQDALMTLKKIMTLRVRDLIMLLEDELEYVEEHLKKINDGYKVKKRAQDVITATFKAMGLIRALSYKERVWILNMTRHNWRAALDRLRDYGLLSVDELRVFNIALEEDVDNKESLIDILKRLLERAIWEISRVS